MGALDGIATGFQVALSLEGIMFVLIGVFVGTFIGMLPGLGPISALPL